MNSVQYLPFVFSLVLFSSVQSKKICNFEEDECLTQGTNKLYKKTIAGVPCVVEPSDTLHIDKIVGTLLCLKYTITNVTLVGFNNCEVTQTSINETAMTYVHNLACSKLVLYFYFEAEGTLYITEIDGKGFAVLTVTDYEIVIKGKFGQFISKKDQKPHFFLITYSLETNTLGKMVFESNDLNKDKEKAEESLVYINKNSKIILDPFFRNPIIKEFMSILIKRVNTVLRMMPIDEVFPKVD